MAHYEADMYAPFLLAMTVEFPQWVVRRVHQVSFVDDDSVCHRTSMDFSLEDCTVGPLYKEFLYGAHLPSLIIPITLMKKGLLENFNIADQSGHPISFLSQDEVTPLVVAMLVEQARIVGYSKPDLGPLLTEIVNSSPGQAKVFLNSWQDSASSGAQDPLTLAKRQLWKNAVFRYLLAAFSANFLACVSLPQEYASGRRIVKFSYENAIPVRNPIKFYQLFTDLLVRQIAWRAVDYKLPILGVTLAASCHIEVLAPEGADIIKTQRLLKLSSNGEVAVLDEQPQTRTRQAHLKFRGSHALFQDRHILNFYLLPQRRGFIRSTFVATGLVALTICLFEYFYLGKSTIGSPSVPSAALLVILPGLLSAWTARPNEHALVSRLLLGLRICVAASAGMAFLMALSIQDIVPKVAKGITTQATVIGSLLVFLVAVIAYLRTGRRGLNG